MKLWPVMQKQSQSDVKNTKILSKRLSKKRNRDIKGELQNYELYIKIHIKQKVLLKDCRKREKRYQERTTKL